MPTIGSVAGYQLTASPDFWSDKGRVFGETSHPHYVSHAARFVAPTFARRDLEGTVSFVETNAVRAPFDVRTRTLEASIGYRTALFDIGYGYDKATASDRTIASAGLGAGLSIGRGISADVSTAYALMDASTTRAGGWRVDFRVTGQY